MLTLQARDGYKGLHDDMEWNIIFTVTIENFYIIIWELLIFDNVVVVMELAMF